MPDNNWHLFVAQTNIVLAALNAKYDQGSLEKHYAPAKSFYVGDGCSKDGDNDQHATFDYYNAWTFQYHLQWINQINPCFDTNFIQKVLREFITNYQYLIGPEGFPILWRSACYRMAAPAPLIFGQAVFPGIIKPDEARRALDSTWKYFIRHGGIVSVNIVQGYCGEDARLLKSYSGQVSCLWSLRSLVAAFYLNNNSPFWLAKPLLIPIEKQDYYVEKSIGWNIIGNKKDGSIVILMSKYALPKTNIKSKEAGILNRFLERLLAKRIERIIMMLIINYRYILLINHIAVASLKFKLYIQINVKFASKY